MKIRSRLTRGKTVQLTKLKVFCWRFGHQSCHMVFLTISMGLKSKQLSVFVFLWKHGEHTVPSWTGGLMKHSLSAASVTFSDSPSSLHQKGSTPDHFHTCVFTPFLSTAWISGLVSEINLLLPTILINQVNTRMYLVKNRGNLKFRIFSGFLYHKCTKCFLKFDKTRHLKMPFLALRNT